MAYTIDVGLLRGFQINVTRHRGIVYTTFALCNFSTRNRNIGERQIISDKVSSVVNEFFYLDGTLNPLFEFDYRPVQNSPVFAASLPEIEIGFCPALSCCVISRFNLGFAKSSLSVKILSSTPICCISA